MKFIQSIINGCQIIEADIIHDKRGIFCKSFNKEIFTLNNINVNFEESYFSRSKKGVIRGMHFQTPPNEISKLVFCSEGEILDVFLDIRPNSKTFGQFQKINLSASNGLHVYMPKGIAHGFQVVSEFATVHYLQSGKYEASNDSGILWNSFGMDWPISNPILSDRDKEFISLNSL